VIDPGTGEVLYEHDAHVPYPTASMVKMMTALVVMDHVESGEIDWDRPVEVTGRSRSPAGRAGWAAPRST
jgi:D-alanyl-D-alanine carboxypeptidase (penicillin-binding protein 5/6)